MKASNFCNPLKQVFLFVFLFLGCQTIEENQDNPIDPRYNAASLSIKDPNLIPFQFAVIETSGISELKESYKGELSGVEVDLYKFEEKSLLLIIPEVAQGKHRLKVNMGNQEKTLELNIGAAKDKINGDQAFKTFTSQIDDYLKNHLPAGSGELGILMAELNASLKSEVEKLPVSEKNLLANVINANGFGFDLNLNPGLNDRSLTDCEKAAEKTVEYILKTIIAGTTGFLALSTPEITFSKVIGSVLTIMAAYYVTEISDEIKKVGEFCYNPFSFILDLINSRIIATEGNESLVFESGKKKDIKIIGNFKSIDFSDPNSSFDFVRDFQKAASEYNESIDKINELIESLSEALSISLPTISETRKVNLVNSGDELNEPIQNPNVSISNISKPNVKLASLTTNPESISVIFEITDDSKEEDFTFKMTATIEGTVLEKTFSATFKSEDTITDPRDGIVYKIVKIGNQTWFAENLRYAGSIPQIASEQAWEATWDNEKPAWAYYNNNPEYDAIYGKLYNWYAVNKGTLCPPGWHIPSDAEWTLLTNYLGGEVVAGGKLKSVTGWAAPNTDATNESGFTGLPGGFRDDYGVFDDLGSEGTWWSSSPYDDGKAWERSLVSNFGELIRGWHYTPMGRSCRCLRD